MELGRLRATTGRDVAGGLRLIEVEMPDTWVGIQFASGNLIDQVDVAVSRDRAESEKFIPVG